MTTWIGFALGSAVFGGLVAILAKAGVRTVPSNLATALRTVVVLVVASCVVVATGTQSQFAQVPVGTIVVLVLSGVATGGSWLCYFRALQLGPVNPVVAVDRSSIVLTVVAGLVLFDEIEDVAVQVLGVALVGVGTLLVVRWQPPGSRGSRAWLPYAFAAAGFAALTTILAKVGVDAVDSNVGTVIRTAAILAVAAGVVAVTGEYRSIRTVTRRDLAFVCLSGVATAASWLCFLRALQIGPVSGVVPVDKLSIVVVAVLAFVVFGERLTWRGALGIGLLVIGTVALAV